MPIMRDSPPTYLVVCSGVTYALDTREQVDALLQEATDGAVDLRGVHVYVIDQDDERRLAY